MSLDQAIGIPSLEADQFDTPFTYSNIAPELMDLVSGKPPSLPKSNHDTNTRLADQ